MDFSLNSDQQFMQESIRKYLESMNQTEIARDYIKQDFKSTKKVWNDLSELGYLGINISEEQGGVSEGILSMVPVFEEIGNVLLPGPYAETLGLVVPLLQKYGTDEQKQKYLPEIVTGKRIFTFACLEANTYFEPESIHLSAKREQDYYLLNGKKTLIPYLELANSVLIITRTCDDEADGLTLFIIDIDESPVETNLLENFDESRSLSEIELNDFSLSMTQQLGDTGKGWQILEEGFSSFNVIITAMMVGSLQKLVDMIAEYASTREQFNRKIGSFQAVKHTIVEMKRDLENARSLTYYAAWSIDNNEVDKAIAVSSARAYTTDSFIRGAGNNVHLHGGIGVTEELDSHLYLKRAKTYENYIGSIEDHLVKVGKALSL